MKKAKLPSIVSILILTLLTSVVWVSLSIYRTLTTKPAPAVPENVSKALTPTLDVNTIKNIESGIFLAPNQIPENVVTGSTAPTATPLVIATPTPQPTATGSAGPTNQPTI